MNRLVSTSVERCVSPLLLFFHLGSSQDGVDELPLHALHALGPALARHSCSGACSRIAAMGHGVGARVHIFALVCSHEEVVALFGHHNSVNAVFAGAKDVLELCVGWKSGAGPWVGMSTSHCQGAG